MNCTVRANLQSREHVRVWRSSFNTLTSSEYFYFHSVTEFIWRLIWNTQHKPTTSHSPCSMSLIECGPVNTDFLVNLQKAELEDLSVQQVDAKTFSLYEKYLQHCNSVFQNAAQDTEDIVKVCVVPQHQVNCERIYCCGDVCWVYVVPGGNQGWI